MLGREDSVLTPSVSGQPSWQAHEHLVGALYESMGYRVIYNSNVDGKQADLLCTKMVDGATEIRLYVDCKNVTTRGRSIANYKVDEFVAAFKSRKEQNGWTHGVMVANVPYSQYAQAAAARHGDVVLKTVDDLYEDMLHIRAYLHMSMRQYEQEGIFDSYIPLRGRMVDMAGSPVGRTASLRRQVDEWLRSGDSRQLVLLGDFGTGKTTFAQSLHYTLAKRYLDKGDCRIPLLLTLRSYYDAPSVEELIERFFALETGARVSYGVFSRLLKTGRFLLLLDGFDEMGAKSDASRRKQNYFKLSRLITSASKTIITSRPAYFVSQGELTSIFTGLEYQLGYSPFVTRGDKAVTVPYSRLSRRIDQHAEETNLEELFEAAGRALRSTTFIQIELFSSLQVRQYIRKREPAILARSRGLLDGKYITARIREIYDLHDLAQRPLLLKLIVDTLPLFRPGQDGDYKVDVDGKELSMSEITPSMLYHVYTEEELRREYEKGEVRQLIDKEPKSELITHLAFRMSDTPTLALERHEVADVVRSLLRPADEETLDHYVQDMRTCSFFVRDAAGGFRFTHKSFFEYYLAKYLLIMFASKKSLVSHLRQRSLPVEIIYFLGDMIAKFQPVYIKTLHEVQTGIQGMTEGNRVCKQNAINLLNHARQPVLSLTGLKADLIVYPKKTMEHVRIENCSIGELRFSKTRAREVVISGGSVGRLVFRGDRITALRLESTRIETLEISAARLNLHIEHSVVQELRCSGSTLNQARVIDSTMVPVGWSDTVLKAGTAAKTVIMSCGNHMPGVPELRQWTYTECVFMDLDCDNDWLAQATFSACLFVRCRKSDDAWTERLKGSSGFFLYPRAAKGEIHDGVREPCRWDEKRALIPLRKLAAISETERNQKYSTFLGLSHAEKLAVVFPANRRERTPLSFAQVMERIDGYAEELLSFTPTVVNRRNQNMTLVVTQVDDSGSLGESTDCGTVAARATTRLPLMRFSKPTQLYRVEATDPNRRVAFSEDFDTRDLDHLHWRIELVSPAVHE